MEKIKKIELLLTIAVVLIFNNTAYSQITQPGAVERYIVRKESVTEPATIPGLTNAEKTRTINYTDGFGRPLQSIVVAGSPNGKDIVSFNKYDEFGRQPKQYLPFEATTSNGAYNDMSTIATTVQPAFYDPLTASSKKIAVDNGPYYAEMSFETSPLQRVLKTGGIGDGFQLNQHYKTLSYRNNTTGLHGDNVQKWVLGSSNATSTATYADNELTVTEVEDEGGALSTVYKDKFGRLILKRQKKDASTSYDTYYVYDNIGNIVYIVPPKAIAKMGGTYNTSSTPELIYQFWYDGKNRIVQKKVPGAKEVYIVYDPLDRVVLTQDGAMRNSNGTVWAYIKYDNANRVIIQGIYTHGSILSQSAMQSYVDGQSCYTTNSTTYYEIRQSGSSGYSNQCFPTSNTEERGYNYYDNYDFDFDGTADYSKQNQGLTGEATATDLTYGLATGSKTKILGTGTWLIQVSFYDQYYHVIQVRSNNQIKTNVTDHTTNVVNFAGQALEAKQVKTIGDPNGITNTLEITVSTRYEYDDMGRLTKVKQTNPGASEITVAKYEYNPLGQLVDKKLHSTNGTNYLQSVDMRYNIRGQLTSINNSTLTNDGVINDESNDVFGMEILYDKQDANLGNSQYYTGMISAVKWKAAGPANTDERSYKYSYDNLYRLTAATYQAKTGSNWTKDANGFNESMSYDENGNIKTLLRKSVIGGTVTTIDDLTYYYRNSDNNNQLENITDAVTTNSAGYGYRNFTNTSSSTPYSYDDNGNLTGDLKKGTTITYNELNKPTLIQISSTKKVEYRYDAAGNRISKYIYNNSSSVTKSIEYIGGYVIENDILSYYSMAEGRVRNEGGGFGLVMKMEYFITDQQGNTRVSFEDNNGTAALIQENSYYAFGMQMAGGYTPTTNPNKKLYNAGSEWQDDIDGLADYYSTFFREYDPIIGRFNGVDVLAELTDEITTYAYADNNPVMMNDPLGDYAGVIRVGPDPGYLLGLEMQRNYFFWHQAQYGGNSSWATVQRLMSLWGWGDWTGSGGGGGRRGGSLNFGSGGGESGGGDVITPFTTQRLREVMGLTNKTDIVSNRRAGRRFQNLGLIAAPMTKIIPNPSDVVNLSRENWKRYSSPERAGLTGGKRNFVVPDGVGYAQVYDTRKGKLQYLEGIFYEVKAVSGVLELNSSEYQIQGLLNATQETALRKFGSAPQIYFITTADTRIGESIKEYAVGKGIIIYQIMAGESLANGTIVFSNALKLIAGMTYGFNNFRFPTNGLQFTYNMLNSMQVFGVDPSPDPEDIQ